MRVVLADLKSDRGFVSKDTVVGGYGSRLDPFSRVTRVMAYLKKTISRRARASTWPISRRFWRARATTCGGRGATWCDGDVALVLSSLVDHKNETAWADRMRARGVKVGFIGITASKMPELFADHCDFILNGEPEGGRHAPRAGRRFPQGIVVSEQIDDLDSLPFPRWDLVTEDRARKIGIKWSSRPVGGGVSAAGQPRLPGVLHLLPAPHSRRLPRALDREHRGRDGAAVRSGHAAVRHLPRSALHRAARPRRRAVRRDPARAA